MKYSIIIPAYNEEGAISKVIDDVRIAMKPTDYEYEIIVVDDASTDNTAAIAESKRAHVIRRTVKGGSGSSRKTGILNAKGEIVVMLDADGTYNAFDIPKMLAYFPKYDQVNGARTSEEGGLRLLRIPAKWFIRKLACYLTRTNIPDLNTGLKAFKKDIMLKYLWVIPNGFSCVTTMTLAFLVNGYAVKYIPTEYYKRIGKSKFHPIKDTANYLQTVLRMVIYFDPLKIFLPISAILFLIGLVKSVFNLYLSSSLQESDIIIITASILIGILGLIADLIVAQRK